MQKTRFSFLSGENRDKKRDWKKKTWFLRHWRIMNQLWITIMVVSSLGLLHGLGCLFESTGERDAVRDITFLLAPDSHWDRARYSIWQGSSLTTKIMNAKIAITKKPIITNGDSELSAITAAQLKAIYLEEKYHQLFSGCGFVTHTYHKRLDNFT